MNSWPNFTSNTVFPDDSDDKMAEIGVFIELTKQGHPDESRAQYVTCKLLACIWFHKLSLHTANFPSASYFDPLLVYEWYLIVSWFLVFAARRILLPSGQLWFVPSRFQPCLTNLPTVKRPFHVGWFCSRVSVLNNICYRQGVIWFHVNVL